MLYDRFGRHLNSLRISVTQRCNLECFYCHREGEIGSNYEMKNEEIVKIAEVACKLGMRKVKLTGGEPLLRRDLTDIVSGIFKYAEEISLTTNGVLLKDCVAKLVKAGLKRVNISLPSLSPELFQRITGKDLIFRVKEGIKAATESQLHPVKINMVMLKGINTHEIPKAIDFAQKSRAVLQLIEFQPIQPENHVHWQKFHYNPTPIENWLRKKAVSVHQNPLHKRRRYTLEKKGNSVGVEVVRPIHNSRFCQNCTRLRVTSSGKLKPCLLRNDNLVEIVSLVRECADSDQLNDAFIEAAALREPYWKRDEKLVRSYI